MARCPSVTHSAPPPVGPRLRATPSRRARGRRRARPRRGSPRRGRCRSATGPAPRPRARCGPELPRRRAVMPRGGSGSTRWWWWWWWWAAVASAAVMALRSAAASNRANSSTWGIYHRATRGAVPRAATDPAVSVARRCERSASRNADIRVDTGACPDALTSTVTRTVQPTPAASTRPARTRGPRRVSLSGDLAK